MKIQWNTVEKNDNCEKKMSALFVLIDQAIIQKLQKSSKDEKKKERNPGAGNT